MSKKRTHTEYLNEINNNFSQIEVIGIYVNANTKILHRCKICSYEWLQKPSHILDGHGCPKCTHKKSKEMRTFSHEQFIEKFKELKNSDISIIGKYVNSYQKIKCICRICNKTWQTLPGNILQGHGCPHCSKNYKKTTNDFIDALSEINKNINIIGEYYGANKKITCECKICNYIWSPLASSLTLGYGCPKCAGKIYTKEDFDYDFKLNGNKDIILLTPYDNSQTKIKCRCTICNNEWYATPYQLKNGVGCKKCADKNRRLTQEEFILRIEQCNSNIHIIGEYITSNDNIKCACRKCGHIWHPRASTILTGSGCPKCIFSKGEERIAKWLQSNKIVYNSQKKFQDLFGVKGGLLSYDFYIPQYNMLIEFQGEQHEHYIEYFGGEEKFKIQQEHDKRKREYAKQNNIHLLEIWYNEIDNIETILLQKITEIIENNLKLESVETVIPA